jgi:SAM-dependent methyltransferase
VAKAFKRKIIDTLTEMGMIEVVNEARGLATMAAPRVLFGNASHRLRGQADGWPIPPSRLIYLVAGTYDIEWFLTLGRRGVQAIRDTLSRNQIDLNSFSAMLDFGCGCGRVIRHFQDLPATKVYGADYNRKLVDWCDRHLTFAAFRANELAPPLPYDDDSFDFVYALSVFTHWGEELQFAWIDEMRRVIKPGGHLFMTTHGQSYLPGLSDDERRAFLDDELVVRRGHLAGKNICTTFYTEKYVRDQLTRGCEVVDFVPEGAKGNPTQDAYLLRFEG